ncbi:MAG: inositol monophosphatase family protein [Desulfomonilaceae bacterium]|nr:inositol monophosphatase family protein [Desulfomonilaceae bacterium]
MNDLVNPKDLLPFLHHITQEAGKRVLSYHRGDFAVERKDTSEKGIDIVTDADRASEELILGEIAKAFPEHDILTEETLTERSGAPWLWLVDPLDGTVNFAHGYPHFSISIALTYNGDLTAGMVYDPLRKESFHAFQNQGTFLNGKAVAVSKARTLQTSIVATGFPYDRAYSEDNNVKEFTQVVTRVQGIRRGGSAALDLAYVAGGRLDGFWELRLKPWDQGAGMLLVQEAGGRVSDGTGRPTHIRTLSIVATNGLIHNELVTVLSRNS